MSKTLLTQNPDSKPLQGLYGIISSVELLFGRATHQRQQLFCLEALLNAVCIRKTNSSTVDFLSRKLSCLGE